MNDKRCLSLMELFDLRAGAEDPEAWRHLGCCPRCQALLAGMPEPRFADLPPRPLRLPPRPLLPRPRRIRTGQLWRAVPLDGTDWAEVVAIVCRPVRWADAYLAVPLAQPPELATDRDLVLGPKPLGYPGFLDLANPGPLVRDQLVEYLGPLPPGQAAGLVSLYRAATGAGDRPAGVQTGLPVLSGQDPRLLEARVRGERLRPLWRVVDRWARARDGVGRVRPAGRDGEEEARPGAACDGERAGSSIRQLGGGRRER
ncbi:MAG: hypothetical protein QOK40_2176 [Miltoncostaeaceae bacterium]|nr:hypothetical protein [Miltoncostaeaceae bacterium]